MDGFEVAEELCRLAGADSLLSWLELPDSTSSEEARAALRARRRKLQSLQGNPKHRHVARWVITRFRVLDALLEDPGAYVAALRQAQARARLPLLDMGMDGVLADRTVTAEEVAFLQDAARRLGLNPDVVLARLRQRAQMQGVRLQPPRTNPLGDGKSHPLLPRGWWGPEVARWLAAQIPGHARRVVEGHCDDGAGGVALLTHRPELQYVGFDSAEPVERAEARFEALELDRATALACAPRSLPVADRSTDVVLFLLHTPDAEELAEARRVTTRGGRVVVVSPGVPRATLEGPLPTLDQALWNLCRAAVIPTMLPARSASTFVVAHTTVGGRAPLRAMLLSRMAAIERHAKLGKNHAAVRGAAQALEAFGDGSEGVGTYQVPLVARVV